MKLVFAIFSLAVLALHAQPNFASGSTGADGALNITGTSGTVITFDPKSFTPPLNPAGDNIFNFTTINIASGVTLRLSGRNLTGPIYFLASGAVTITGTLDLSGEAGPTGGSSEQVRTIAYPGAGGYAGGAGGRTGLPAQPGSGPGGGAVATSATFTGNTFLVPLVGGSGGGGYTYPSTNIFGGGGSAGGGAILIASSVSIAVTGIINTNAGANSAFQGACNSGNGSGGAIRLVAPIISGSGTLTATTVNCGGNAGRVRIETANFQFAGNIGAPYTVTSTPNIYLPTVQPGSLQLMSIGGVTVPASPTGSFSVPDTVINTTSPVSVVVQASQIPPGTTVTLQFFSEDNGDFTATTSALSGTMASSTATASVTFPTGFTRGYAKASW